MATTTIKCFVTLTNGSAVVTLTAGNAGNAGISFAAPNVTEDMLLVLQDPLNATRFIKGSLGTTSLELQEPWSGAGVVGAQARISTSGAAVQNLTQAVRDLVNQKEVAAEALLGVGDVAIAAAAAQQLATEKAALADAAATTATQKAGDVTAGVTAATNAGNAAAADALIASQKAADAVAAAAESTEARDLALQAWVASTAPAATLPAVVQLLHSGNIVAQAWYNTREDSDPNWRLRCAWTSWYQEAIQSGKWLGQKATASAAWATVGAAAGDYFENTPNGKFYVLGATNPTVAEITRGGGRDFPALPVGVLEAGRLVIYDASAPGCPMWMVFTQFGSNGSSDTDLNVLGGTFYNPLTSVAFAEGKVFVTASQGGSDAGVKGLYTIDFAADRCRLDGTPGFGGVYRGSIAERNAQKGFDRSATYSLPNRNITSVAAKVLTGAPTDPVTGLSVPTVALGTITKICVLKHDGTIANSTLATGFARVRFGGDTLYADQGASSSYLYYARAGAYLTDGFALSIYTYSTSPAIWTASIAPTAMSAARSLAVTGRSGGVTLLRENPAEPTKSMVAYISGSVPGFWQWGANKRCLMVDSVAGAVTGSGDIFDLGSTAGLTVGPWSVDAGAKTASCSGASGLLSRAGALTSGVAYTYTIEVLSRASGGIYPPYDGTNGVSISSVGVFTGSFVATATSLYLYSNAFSGVVGNISVRRAEADRSSKARGLTLNGTLTKTAVAAGAQLVCYSGFSAANYLQDSFSTDLEFASGDFTVMGWARSDSGNYSAQSLLQLWGSNGRGIKIGRASVGSTYPLTPLAIVTGSTGTYQVAGSTVGVPAMATAKWHQIALTRSVNVFTLYLDAVPVNSATVAVGDISTLDGMLTIGSGFTVTSYEMSTLGWRLGPGAISADDLKYVYATERMHFAPGAQGTLVGGSAVTAVDFDGKLGWQACTATYRNSFYGLVRVESEASLVGAIKSVNYTHGGVLLSGDTGARLSLAGVNLRAETMSKADARPALFWEVIADGVKNRFPLPAGLTPIKVELDGVGKRNPTVWSLPNNGSCNELLFVSTPAAGTWVTALLVEES